MHARSLGRTDELTNLFQPVGRQPALSAPALDRETIGDLFARPAELVAALVGVDPQLDRRRARARPGAD